MKNNIKCTDVATTIATWVIAFLVLFLLLHEAGLSIQNFSADVWVAICAAFIALCALAVSIYQIRLSEQHNRLSVKPQLTIHCPSSDNGRIGLKLINSGLGPAILKKAVIMCDSITAECNKEGFPSKILKERYVYEGDKSTYLPGDFEYSLILPETTIAQGDSIWLIYHDTPSSLQREYWVNFLQQKNGMHLIVTFESMYGDETFRFDGVISLSS
ncbi:hypothetical protein [Shewanella xiamenensis]|uniref:hypothetical protein n=1 Tax=Shewanella xiamenensis TaxID=332186 RepID=UPI00217DA9E2|nr:hypothetical protein [Shewanella xiamenensis]MCT8872668.1 hypothetical protein [Shewanella xiamenensis]UWH42685.1 hypothetical protein KXJ80_05355 [Shewanella xiamenensis]